MILTIKSHQTVTLCECSEILLTTFGISVVEFYTSMDRQANLDENRTHASIKCIAEFHYNKMSYVLSIFIHTRE